MKRAGKGAASPPGRGGADLPISHARRIQLTTGPAAAAEARGQVGQAISAWEVPVDAHDAVLLTSELVTNAIKYTAGDGITLNLRCARNHLRVEVHDTSSSLFALRNPPADSDTERRLMLVASLATEWGFYRISTGKTVYFTLAFQSAIAGSRPDR